MCNTESQDQWEEMLSRRQIGEAICGVVSAKTDSYATIDFGERFDGRLEVVEMQSSVPIITKDEFPQVGDSVKGTNIQFNDAERFVRLSQVSIPQ